MKVVTGSEYENEIKEGYVLVDFYADWCGPCKMIAPVLNELQLSHADKIKFIKVDVDKDPEIAQKYGVMSIPTLVLLNNTDVVKKAVGFQSKPMLQEFIKEAI